MQNSKISFCAVVQQPLGFPGHSLYDMIRQFEGQLRHPKNFAGHGPPRTSPRAAGPDTAWQRQRAVKPFDLFSI